MPRNRQKEHSQAIPTHGSYLKATYKGCPSSPTLNKGWNKGWHPITMQMRRLCSVSLKYHPLWWHLIQLQNVPFKWQKERTSDKWGTTFQEELQKLLAAHLYNGPYLHLPLPQLRWCKHPQCQGNCQGPTNSQTRRLCIPKVCFWPIARGDKQFECN